MSSPIFTLLNLPTSLLSKNDFKSFSMGSDSIHNCNSITIEHITLIFRGYIYNLNELYPLLKTPLDIKNNYEIIIHLYQMYGLRYTISLLQGSFVFILFDNNYYKESSKMYVVRDTFGIEPLYILNTKEKIEDTDLDCSYHPTNSQKSNPLFHHIQRERGYSETNIHYHTHTISSPVYKHKPKNIIGFSSHLQNMSYISNLLMNYHKQDIIQQFPPGYCYEYTYSYQVLSCWEKTNSFQYSSFPITRIHRYNTLSNEKTSSSTSSEIVSDNSNNNIHAFYSIRNTLINAIDKQISAMSFSQKQGSYIGCLLSGGLDSSIIAALVNEYCILQGFPPLETFSIGFYGSEDLKHAKQVSEYLGTKHREVIITEKDYFVAMEKTIKTLETYDPYTIRSGISNYLINQWIVQHSHISLLFTGDGADELMGGHLHLYKSKDALDFDKNCKELLSNIHYFDVLRTTRISAKYGIQICMPFLDQIVVENYLSIPINMRYQEDYLSYNHFQTDKYNEKLLLRMAFSKEYSLNRYNQEWIPSTILWRTREDFSDGLVSSQKKTFKIIHDYISLLKIDMSLSKKYTHNKPKTLEQLLYRELFEKYYPTMGNILPYLWIPKYIDTNDPSPKSSNVYEQYMFWKNGNS